MSDHTDSKVESDRLEDLVSTVWSRHGHLNVVDSCIVVILRVNSHNSIVKLHEIWNKASVNINNRGDCSDS